MEKKRNLSPKSSQLVEPPLKQHKSEAEEEEEDDEDFEVSSTRPFGQTSMRRSSSTPAFGSSSTSFVDFELLPFGQTNSAMRRSSSTPAFGLSTSFGGFGQKPACMPIIIQKLLEEVRKETELEAIQTEKQAAFSGTSMAFGAMRPGIPLSFVSFPAITEEDGDTSERYESCFAIAGADYCVIAADFTRGHTKISELSRKSMMASCGFQGHLKNLQKALSAANLRYEYEHNKPMSCPEMHSLFHILVECDPNYDFIVMGGLDSEGRGCVFENYGFASDYTIASEVGHPGSRLTVAPILEYKLPARDVLARLSETEAVGLAEDMFKSATNTGDELEIVVLNAIGLHRHHVDLT